MFGKLESIVSSALGLSSSPRSFSRRSFLYATGISALAAACSGSGGSSGNNDTPSDTTPPAATDIYAYESDEHGELVDLVWQSPGDDNLEGTPSYFLIKYSADPILTEEAWDKASDLGSIDAVGPVGTNYDETLPCPAGEWYFGIKTFDEAGNASEVSDYPQGTPVKVPTREEFYVDKWLPGGKCWLNYDESVALMQGDASNGVDSKARQLAEIFINTNDSDGVAWSSYATVDEIEANLLDYSDGTLAINNPEFIKNITDAGNLSSRAMGFRCNIDVTDGNVVEQRVQDFKDMNDTQFNQVYGIIRDSLIQQVSAYPGRYDNINLDYDPDW